MSDYTLSEAGNAEGIDKDLKSMRSDSKVMGAESRAK